MPDTELLTDQQIAEIEVREYVVEGWSRFIKLRPDERDSLIATVKQLRSELADEKRLRAELKQIAQTGIAEVSSVGTTLSEIALRDFRSRAVDLCNQKAAEYRKEAAYYERGDEEFAQLNSYAAAADVLATELEKLT